MSEEKKVFSLVILGGQDEIERNRTRVEIESFFQKMPFPYDLIFSPTPNELETLLKPEKPKYAVFTDSTLSVPLATILKFISELEEKPEISLIYANRNDTKSRVLRAYQWSAREQRAYAWIEKKLRAHCADPLTPFYIFRISDFQNFHFSGNASSVYLAQLIHWMQKKYLKFLGRPVSWSPTPFHSSLKEHLQFWWAVRKL